PEVVLTSEDDGFSQQVQLMINWLDLMLQMDNFSLLSEEEQSFVNQIKQELDAVLLSLESTDTQYIIIEGTVTQLNSKEVLISTAEGNFKITSDPVSSILKVLPTDSQPMKLKVTGMKIPRRSHSIQKEEVHVPVIKQDVLPVVLQVGEGGIMKSVLAVEKGMMIFQSI
ncbi:MAG: hypothetical protein KKD05_01945, partial [Candidatus Omnitrophica bacterium]|nr:hypothetical protein [Candidatus Omnitrophota bacterium]